MADFLTPTQRSDVMSRVRGHGNTATELQLIQVFRRHKIIGWRRNIPIFGKPDFVFAAIRVALFVDGCFWHGCPRHKSYPVTNRSFWQKKLEGNIARDKLVNKTLRKNGWKVVRVWQHELKGNNHAILVARLNRLGLRPGTAHAKDPMEINTDG
jgi:DNA mismatch endonuclease (patch repair protein)